MRKILIFSILFLLPLSLTSCTSTKLTSTWKDNTYEGYIDTLMVVAVTENTRNRLIFEREFVEEFTKAGIEAIASIDVIPRKRPQVKMLFLPRLKNGEYL